MDNIGSRSIQKLDDSQSFANMDPKYMDPIESVSCTGKTLKAVYPHFAQISKRKPIKDQMSDQENLDREKLKLAMEKATEEYKAMREIQLQLTQIYKELKGK